MTFIIIIIILKNGNQYWISKLLYLSTKKKNTVEDKKVIFPHKKLQCIEDMEKVQWQTSII